MQHNVTKGQLDLLLLHKNFYARGMFNVRSFRILCSELLKTHDKAIDRATRGKPSAKKKFHTSMQPRKAATQSRGCMLWQLGLIKTTIGN
ncbi:uncharacterized protein PHALS_06749 [Plasmopara halstedii]|uniref:Uncharacterized protein n=1 Tax=Plasmopara halstedii TaxID=4781 RepID=A0A0P1B2L0_PLAHL|nr:uncharacterized protein PHALS_06749 [Plasmopara halstedii]CEG48959.1 hypothetical protein PHALS_06749 [Plasmopara halstedii]|eukprot:XP_024585328.1 hypothetical protein PHALS_06749 [Plasmopara halstedii]